MAPELIPYGWGFFVEGKGIVDLAGEPSFKDKTMTVVETFGHLTQ